jgi:hypothetical protein
MNNLLDEFTVNNSGKWDTDSKKSTYVKELGAKYKGQFILIDKQDRSKLSEGRNYQMGFGFATKKGFTIELAYPISPCRDYLNDEVWSEVTGKSYSAYGLNSSKKNLFKNNEAYLVFSICKQGRNLTEYSNYKRDYNMLAENYKNLQIFLNWFEDKLNVKQKTKITKLEDNKYLAVFDLFWSLETYKISLFTLLMRIGFFYKKGDCMEYLNKFEYNSDDKYLINTCIDKISRLLKGEIPKQDLSKVYAPHNIGICSFNW